MKRLFSLLFIMGAVMLLAGAAVYITGWKLSPYLYSLGAVIVAVMQFASAPVCHSVTLKRLRRQQLFGALLLLVTGALMFFAHGNEWILSLTIAAILELYTALRMPQEESKR
ncbi:MAG: hypothetical protein LUB83_04940 [Prevotellaceae bacterium]|nr:hypothetical protein [Prevotellaceae bacterium]